eukprot:8391313-Alexandrium_andersonii.AAC.1
MVFGRCTPLFVYTPTRLDGSMGKRPTAYRWSTAQWTTSHPPRSSCTITTRASSRLDGCSYC